MRASPPFDCTPLGGSPGSTAASSPSRHGPASDGATMSASEVIVQLSMSSSKRPVAGSKIVATIGTSGSRWRTSSAARSGQASSRETTATASAPRSSASRSSSAAVFEAGGVGARRLQRSVRLVGEVPAPQQEDPP